MLLVATLAPEVAAAEPAAARRLVAAASSGGAPSPRSAAAETQAADAGAGAVEPAPPAPAPAGGDLAPAADVPQRVTITGSAAGQGEKASATATGLDLGLRETPQSISVLSRPELDDFGLASINDALALAPGITVEPVETDRTYYTSRGFDVTQFQIDGLGLPFTNGNQAGDVDTFLYERIDVLRGANGLTSFTGNPSATIDFIRKRPTRTLQATAGVTLGSWDRLRVDGDLSTPLDTSGSLRGRVVALGERRDSYLDRYHLDKRAFAAALDVDLSPRTTLELGAMQQDNDADSPMWGALPLTHSDGTPTHYARGTSTAPDWSWWNNTDRRLSAELSHDFGNGWKATGTATRRRLVSNSELFYVYGLPDAATGEGTQAYPSSFDGRYDQSTVDLRVAGPFRLFGRTHAFSLGADWGREVARERSGYPAQGIGDPVPDLATWDGDFPKPAWDGTPDGSDYRTTRRALFAAAHLAVTDTLDLVLGASWTSIASAGTNYGDRHAYARAATTPYAGATWDVGDDTTVYASFTRIFNPQTQIDRAHETLAPIRGSNLEAGVKSEWFAKKLLASFAVFRTRQDGTAVQDADTDFNPTTYHAEDAVSTGYEAELAGRLAPGWDIDAGWTQLRLRHPDGSPANRYVPRRTLKVATTWRLPSAPGVKIGASLRWQDDTTTADATTRQPSYAMVGLMAAWDIAPHWRAGLDVDNLTNEKPWASLYWTQAYHAPPRHWTASLRWTY